jgi:hypothetical protein
MEVSRFPRESPKPAVGRLPILAVYLPSGRKIEYLCCCYARLSQAGCRKNVITRLDVSQGKILRAGLSGQDMRRTIAFAATLLACGLATAPVRAQADRARTIEELHKKSTPIVFFIAHGAADSCGAGCDTWIAGDGRIDEDAPAHLRRVLEQAGKRKLPIYFNSPGGGMREAMQMGRMLRSHGLTAGVARTLPQGCWPAKGFDVCSKAMHEKPAEPAELVTTGASCLSACPFALFGATTRWIEPTALLGVHEALAYFKRTNGVGGRRLELALQKLESKWDNEFSRYLVEMGIGKGLFAIVKQTPFEKVHYLTRAELIAFGIDRRDLVVQAGWNVDYLEPASIGSAAYVSIAIKSKAGELEVAPMTLAISCAYRPGGGYLLTSLRPIVNAAARASTDLFMKADYVDVPLTANSSFLDNNKGQLFEVRQARLARLVLDLMGAAKSLSLSGDLRHREATAQGAATASSTATSSVEAMVSNFGLADAVKMMEARCERK